MSKEARREHEESDDGYMVRCLSLFVDEIRRRLTTKDEVLLRLSVKVEQGRIESIRCVTEDSFKRL